MPVSSRGEQGRMYKRYWENKSHNIWGTVEILFSIGDYEDFEDNNYSDCYIDAAWEIYKCEIIHDYVSNIPEHCSNLILVTECPLEGRHRNLYRRNEHSGNFRDCEDCILPWLLTNF